MTVGDGNITLDMFKSEIEILYSGRVDQTL